MLLGLAAYFVSSSRNFSETERVSRQIENGRYAAALLSEEVRHAGFYGEVGNVVNLPAGSGIALPGALPNPCDTAIANVRAALSLPIQGVDNDKPACLSDYVTGTDVLVIRRSNTETVAATSAGPGGSCSSSSTASAASATCRPPASLCVTRASRISAHCPGL